MVISTTKNGMSNSIGEKNVLITGSGGITGENEHRKQQEEEDRRVRIAPFPNEAIAPEDEDSPPMEQFSVSSPSRFDLGIGLPLFEYDMEVSGFGDDGFAGKWQL